MLVIQGSEDGLRDPQRALDLAEELGASVVMFEGSGHAPHVRDPVKVNLLIRDFAQSLERSAR